MLTISNLGKYGRLGNQLFQLAFLHSTAKKSKQKVVLEKWFCNYTQKEMSKYFNLMFWKDNFENLDYEIILEEKFSYEPIKKDIRKGNFDFVGYFQSEKYFFKDKKDILNLFSPSEYSEDIINTKYKNFDWKDSCFLHVRRGDYVFNKHHYVCGESYYNDAIFRAESEIKNLKKFVVFSDDIEWCKRVFKGDKFVFIEGNDDVIDLFCMSKCYHGIMSNSSFSWWGSYLMKNKNKKIYVPSIWLPLMDQKDCQDIYTNFMIKL